MMDDIRTGVVSFNSNSTEILIQRGEKISDDPHTDLGHIVSYNFHNDEDFSSNDLVDGRCLLLALEDIGRLEPNLDFSVDGQQSRKGIKLITGLKYRKKYYSRMHYPFIIFPFARLCLRLFFISFFSLEVFVYVPL